ncbi:hypothetical protein F383_34174 [Gossypium arboreum]|uniref:Uncharacterized protein n=1 Tax=Gossypium arboreum TaxID=29729 RepID=A0A0B0N6C5_GOSAR|nr:hypothetical protein F383_34174 [Gossypium arboreum]
MAYLVNPLNHGIWLISFVDVNISYEIGFDMEYLINPLNHGIWLISSIDVNVSCPLCFWGA